MMHVLDDDLSDALDKWEELTPIYAKAKGQRIHLHDFRKSKHSALTLEAEGSTNAEREHKAYAHEDYLTVIKAYGIASEHEVDAFWRLWSGDIKIPEGSEGKTMQIAAWYNEAYTNKEGHNVKENLGLTITEPWEGGSKSDFKPKYHVAPAKDSNVYDDPPF